MPNLFRMKKIEKKKNFRSNFLKDLIDDDDEEEILSQILFNEDMLTVHKQVQTIKKTISGNNNNDNRFVRSIFKLSTIEQYRSLIN